VGGKGRNTVCDREDNIVLLEYPIEIWGELPNIYNQDKATMVGIRNQKYGRTVIAFFTEFLVTGLTALKLFWFSDCHWRKSWFG
jgi:hypothetical protein